MHHPTAAHPYDSHAQYHTVPYSLQRLHEYVLRYSGYFFLFEHLHIWSFNSSATQKPLAKPHLAIARTSDSSIEYFTIAQSHHIESDTELTNFVGCNPQSGKLCEASHFSFQKRFFICDASHFSLQKRFFASHFYFQRMFLSVMRPISPFK